VYKEVGFNKRQVVEINLSRIVKEYRLQIVEDETGKQYTAEAPEGLSRPIQYGQSVKAMSVYMSLYQLIPYGRVEEYFRNQVGIPVSAGSLCNFNKEAFEKLARFEEIAKKKLMGSAFIHTDETSINVNSKTTWLHNASNDKWTLFAPHAKRGTEAMDAIGILPEFKGVMIHDHWKPYYTYTTCQHALCNAHHLRELQAVIELAPDHAWAQNLKDLLLAINEATQKADGVLPKEIADNYRACYREIIKVGELECPLPPAPELPKKKRGKIKKSKERNLLERLRNFEDDVLRFMIVKYVPFTNNQGENDIRMTKVQQKISGCFKSFEGAQIFCLVRSYLLTCQKHNLSATDALDILFKGNLPDFCL
jgi:transposase